MSSALAQALPCLNSYVDGSDLVLLHRDESGEIQQRRQRAEYVTFHKFGEVPDEMRRSIESSAHVTAARRDGDWYRVSWASFESRRHVCGEEGPFRKPVDDDGMSTAPIKIFEGDVHPVRRYLVDSGAAIQKPRIVFLDLETDSRVPFSRKEEMRLLTWALVDTEANTVATGVLSEDDDDAEEVLIRELFAALSNFDQVAAWNGDSFDFTVLFARMKKHRIRIDARRWLWLDHMLLFKRMNMQVAESGDEKTSMKLQDVAMATVNEGKSDFNGARTWQAWNNEWVLSPSGSRRCPGCGKAHAKTPRECLLEYNVQDTKLLAKIEKENNFIEIFFTIAEACGVFPDTFGLLPSNQIDTFMLRLGLARQYHFPTRKFGDDDDEQQFRGAFVMEPEFKGITKDVHVCDFSRLYPSIIITWNLSPDTRANGPVNGPIPEGQCRAPGNGTCWSTKVRGMLPTALLELIRLRKYWNDVKATLPPGSPEWHDADRKSNAYKVAANAFYGVVGAKNSRYYDIAVVEAVTQTGVYLIKSVIHTLQMQEAA